MSATLKKCLLIIITFFYFSFAQAQKIAHCNYDSLMKVMPETKIADSLLQAFIANIQAKDMQMQKEYDSLSNKLNANAQIWSKEVMTIKQNELEVKMKRIQAFQGDGQLDIAARREELLVPLRKKILLAISMVAKENGYAFILNSATDSNQVLYFDQSNNVSKKVKNKLDYMQPAWVH